MNTKHKKVFVYGMVLFLAAAMLITLSAISQNRVTKSREEELKNDLTLDITERLKQTMQQNIDQINEENTALKEELEKQETQAGGLEKDIVALRLQIEILYRDLKIAEEKVTLHREIESKIKEAYDFYNDGMKTKAGEVVKEIYALLERNATEVQVPTTN